jgi:hypothetical protein
MNPKSIPRSSVALALCALACVSLFAQNPPIDKSRLRSIPPLPLEGRAGADSLLQQAISSPQIIQSDTLSRFRSKTIQTGSNRTLSIAELASTLFAETEAAEGEFRRIPSRALQSPVTTEDRAVELPESFLLVRSVRMVVKDPNEASTASMTFRNFRSTPVPPGSVNLSDLDEESRAGFQKFMRDELPNLPASDPLALAARSGGELGVLVAIAEGKGEFEMIESFEIPKRLSPTVNNRVQVLDIGGPVFDNASLRTLRSEPMMAVLRLPARDLNVLDDRDDSRDQGAIFTQKSGRTPSRTSGGVRRMTAEFLTGFTCGHAWKWEKRWRYPSGFFRLSLGAGYGFGLRIPIKARGLVEPTQMSGSGERDSTVPYRSEVSAGTIDADVDFYARTGLPQNQIYGGKEALFELQFYYGYKFRALWKDILHKPRTEVGFNHSQDWQPPFARSNPSVRFEIPPRVTGTEFNFAVMKGYARVGFKLSGTGEVGLDVHNRVNGVDAPVRKLAFQNDTPKIFMHDTPPLVAEPGGTAAGTYGLKIGNPTYTFRAKLTPEIKATVNVGYSWLSRSFSTGWVSLNALAIDLGSLEFGRHAGTQRWETYDIGRKSFTQIGSGGGNTPPAAVPPVVGNSPTPQSEGGLPRERSAVTLTSAYSGKLVRAGAGDQSYLAAWSEKVASWEKFEWVPLSNGQVAIRSLQNQKYVRAGVGKNSHLAAASDEIRSWETFRVHELGGGKIALQSVQSGLYVRAGIGDYSFLAAISPQIAEWETFTLKQLPEGGR